LLAGAGDEALLGLAGVADADADVLTAPVRNRCAMSRAATAKGVSRMWPTSPGYTLGRLGLSRRRRVSGQDVLLAYGADDERRSARHWLSGSWTGLPSAELQL
jgi:hypothetical protein